MLTATNHGSPGAPFQKGVHTLDGEGAAGFVRAPEAVTKRTPAAAPPGSNAARCIPEILTRSRDESGWPAELRLPRGFTSAAASCSKGVSARRE